MALKLYHAYSSIFNSTTHRGKSLTSILICSCDTSSHIPFSNDNLGGRSPREEVIFIQRFYREIHLIFVSITPHSPPKLALLPCLAIPSPVFTVAISNLSTPREVASIPHSSHASLLFAFCCTRG